ncbi:LAMI_0D04874g1_1 [Lachancea mirantina]|uniref:Serine/threonine-protein kinase Tel1 n=1 Tax=Lachancea mirantina TaxID=1230905 RepID=A0A1G4JAV4_9SACH|nr:LAMI_0D04874g1_1 [Lachancea mirantina]
MDTYHVSNIVDALSSSKIKERHTGLNDLTTILKENPAIIEPKCVLPVIERLTEIIDLERSRFCSLLHCDATTSSDSKVTAVENRLSEAAYVLRLFVEKTVSSYKSKHMKFLLVMITELVTFDGGNSLLVPVSSHLLLALSVLIESDIFRLKFEPHQWVSLIKRCSGFLTHHLSVDPSDKSTFYLILILADLLTFDVCEAGTMSRDVLAVLLAYFQNVRTDTPCTKNVFRLLNNFLLKLHLVDLFACCKALESALAFIVSAQRVSGQDSEYELAVFAIMASDLVVKGVTILDRDGVSNLLEQDDLFDIFQGFVTFGLNSFKPSVLFIDDISSSGQHVDFSWLERVCYSVDVNNEGLAWLQLYSLTRGVEEYFQLSGFREATETSLLFKRRKTADDLRSIFLNSYTTEGFIENCLESSFEVVQLLGLQLCNCYASNYLLTGLTIESLFNAVFRIISLPSLSGWAFWAIIPLLKAKNSHLPETSLLNLFKISLPYIRSTQLCGITCKLLATVLSFQEIDVMSDLSLGHQIDEIYTLPTVYGPTLMNNECFQFWVQLQRTRKPLSQQQAVASVYTWLTSKWELLDITSVGQNTFPTFLGWICGQDYWPDFPSSPFETPRFLEQYYRPWNSFKEQRDFLLHKQTDLQALKVSNLVLRVPVDIERIKGAVARVLDLCLHFTGDPLHELKLSASCMRIFNTLANDASVRSLIIEFENHMKSRLQNIFADDEMPVVPCLCQLLEMLNYPRVSASSIKGLDLTNLLTKLQSELRHQALDDEMPMDDFIPNKALSSVTSSECKLSELSLLKFAIYFVSGAHRLRGESFSFTIKEILRFLTPLPLSLIQAAATTLIALLKMRYEDADVKSLETVTLFLGSTLLSTKCNTSDVSLEALVSFLDTTRNAWLVPLNKSLNTDCNDILEWITDKLSRAEASGLCFVQDLSRLLLNMLNFHNLSSDVLRGGKQKVFETFSKCLKLLPSYAIVPLVSDLAEYLGSLSYKNQVILLTEIKDTFALSSECEECGGHYALSLVRFVADSLHCFLDILFDIISYRGSQNMATYIKEALQRISTLYDFDSPLDILKMCQFEIIDNFIGQSHQENITSMREWPFSLFGDFSLNQFVLQYRDSIAALYFSKTGLPRFVISELLEICPKLENELFADSLHYSVPLAYRSGGLQDGIMALAIKKCGKDVRTYLSDISLEIAYWCLFFADLSVDDVIRKTLKNGFSKYRLLPILLRGGTKRRCTLRMKIQIPTHVALGLLINHITHHNMGQQELRILLERLCLEIFEKAPVPELQLSALKAVKTLIVLFESRVEIYEHLSWVVKMLSPLLTVDSLFHEVKDIILGGLHMSQRYSSNSTDMFAAISCSLLHLHRKDAELIDEELIKGYKKGLLDCTSYLQSPQVWQSCVNILENESLPRGIYFEDELLQSESLNVDRVAFLSALYEYFPEPKAFRLDFNFNEVVIKNLLNLNSKTHALSSNFNQWRGLYLGGFYLKRRKIPKSIAKRSALDLRQYFQGDNNKMLAVLIDLIFTGGNFQDVPSYIKSTVTGYLLNSPSLKAFNGLEIVKNIPVISEPQFRLMHNNRHVPGFSFTRRHQSHNQEYKEQLSNILTSLINELLSYDHVISGLKPLADYDERACEELSLRLLHDVFSKHPDKAYSLFTSLFKSANFIRDSKSNIREAKLFSLRAFALIRTGAKNGLKTFLDIYTRLDRKEYYNLAVEADEMKFALMIIEESSENFHFDLTDPNLPLIFRRLDDNDSLGALPTEPSLKSAFASLSNSHSNRMKSFVLSNSDYDARLFLKEDVNTGSLLASANLNGFRGLSKILEYDKTGELNSEEDIYRWGIELGQWDLPFPQNKNTKTNTLYHILAQTDLGSLRKTLKKSIENTIEARFEFPCSQEWLTTLSSITLFENLCENWATEEFSAEYYKLITSLNRNLETSGVENSTFDARARNIFTWNLANFDNSLSMHILKQYAFTDLVGQIRGCREKGDVYGSLFGTMIFDKMTQDARFGFSETPWRKLAIVETAKTLWNQEEHSIAINMLRSTLEMYQWSMPNCATFFDRFVEIPEVEVKSLLVEWLSISRQEAPDSIYKGCIGSSPNDLSAVKDYDKRAEIYYRFAEFCYGQVRKLTTDKNLQDRRLRYESAAKELRALHTMAKNANITDGDRKDAKKHFSRLRLQCEQDREIISALTTQLNLFSWKALQFYLNTMVFSNDRDDDVLDKFCGMWFQFSSDDEINSKLYGEIGSIASFKFLPWINQMTSRLSDDMNPFQRTLQLTLKRVMFKLPYDSLYPLLSMKLYRNYTSKDNTKLLSKVKVVEKLMSELENYENGCYIRDFINPMNEFCEMCIDLANVKPPKNTRMMTATSLKFSNYWLHTLKMRSLPLPTVPQQINCSADGRSPRPTITSVSSQISISTSGLSLPKIVTFSLSDGSSHKVLMKGSNDDLRQDAIMEQVFKQVNKILSSSEVTKKERLRVRTYEVIPMGPQAGIIEFVSNSTALHEVLSNLHKNDKLSFDQARKAMKSVQGKSKEERLDVYLEITSIIKPLLRQFFSNSFTNPEDWLEAKYTYTKGVATTSIVSYILGLGDRHLNNILLDKSSGEPIHIDLGVAFDQGRLLPIPELVPFRLTRDLVDGFGVTQIDGKFRKSCERAYRVLRENYGKVMNVLNVLKWDPLYSWVMTPLRKQKLQADISEDPEEERTDLKNAGFEEDNNQSLRALQSVKEKLIGNGLSVEATIHELIQQATDEQNLAMIYMGWSPFY